MGNANYEAYKSWKCENFSCLSFDDVSRAKVLEANKNMRGHLQIVAVVSRCSIHRSIWTFPSSQLMLFGICTGFQCLRLPCYLAFPSSRKPDSMPPPSNAAAWATSRWISTQTGAPHHQELNQALHNLEFLPLVKCLKNQRLCLAALFLSLNNE